MPASGELETDKEQRGPVAFCPIWAFADDLALEALYAALAPVEKSLDRKINPTLYTSTEYEQRRAAGHPFLTRVLDGEHLVLISREDDPVAAR